MALTPYWYQQEAILAPEHHWASVNPKAMPLIVVPTGGGKSLINAEIMIRYHRNWGARVLSLTHVQELVEQNSAELIGQWPEAPVGIFAAGLKRKEAHFPLTFGMIQSMIRAAHVITPPDIILVDEAHLVSPNDATMYRKFFQLIWQRNPMMKVIGLTATHFRMQTGMLHTGKNALFTDVCYEIPISLLIEEGKLSTVRTKRGEIELDTSKLHKRGGEFIAGEAGELIAGDEDFMRGAIDQTVEYGANRAKWIMFCSSVDNAIECAAALRERGISAEALYSNGMSKDRRKELIDAHRYGDLRCLTSVGILTTGFNSPRTDLVVFLRPTMSPGLYVQMVGRGMRIAEGKEDCLVLDFVGNVRRHGPIDMLTINDKTGEGGGDAPMKECPECGELVYTGVRICPGCGHEFEFKTEEEVVEAPSDAPILASQMAPIFANVDRVMYRNTRKSRVDPNKKDTMRVDYMCGFDTYTEWVCVEHTEPGLQRKAKKWFAARGLEKPAKVDDAVELCKARAPRIGAISVLPGKGKGSFDDIREIHVYEDEQAALGF